MRVADGGFGELGTRFALIGKLCLQPPDLDLESVRFAATLTVR